MSSDKFDVKFLAPASLLKVQVRLGSRYVSALLDSGSSRSLIRSDLVGSYNCTLVDDSIRLETLGRSNINVKGDVELELGIFDDNFNMKFLVIEPAFMENQMVLGVDFFKANNIAINMKSKTITIYKPDGSIISHILNDDGDFADRQVLKMPVYARDNVLLNKNDLSKIPVKFSVNFLAQACKDAQSKNDVYFYEPHNEVEGLDGIIDPNSTDSFILSKFSNSHKRIKINDCVGYVYNLNVIDTDMKEADWDIETLKNAISLGQQLSESEQKRIYDMLMRVKDSLSTNDNDIGLAQVEPHKINLKKNLPIWQKARNFSQPVNDEIEN